MDQWSMAFRAAQLFGNEKPSESVSKSVAKPSEIIEIPKLAALATTILNWRWYAQTCSDIFHLFGT
jgi:hypothetical protein